ncbi:MAG: FkbM family methyltransferase, partial [Bacillus cereus]|nr:FkbM family methyltransferase [Bacillus cereus]
EPALNTFSEDEAKLHDNINSYYIIDKKNITMCTLANVLDSYLPLNTHIDFMSVDVEGLDLAVLKSNDWNKYRPSMLLVESLREDLDLINKNSIYTYLKDLGYHLVAKTYNTMFFNDEKTK